MKISHMIRESLPSRYERQSVRASVIWLLIGALKAVLFICAMVGNIYLIHKYPDVAGSIALWAIFGVCTIIAVIALWICFAPTRD